MIHVLVDYTTCTQVHVCFWGLESAFRFSLQPLKGPVYDLLEMLTFLHRFMGQVKFSFLLVTALYKDSPWLFVQQSAH